jgi:N-acetylmuramoyl-L-alanine amidase
MPISHTVQQGEHISRIAAKYGFLDYHTIWDDPSNAALKKRRVNPNVLHPGDQLQIPDKMPKTAPGETALRHTFKLRRTPLKLRLVLRDFDNEPVANTPCELEIEGTKHQLKTNGDGLIEKDVAATAETGRLIVPSLDVEVAIQIGHLDPPEEETGWLARLMNLGYGDDRLGTTSAEDLLSDVEEFQCDYKLKVTGILDDATKAELKKIHGC